MSKGASRLGARKRTKDSSFASGEPAHSAGSSGSGSYARVRSDGTLGGVDEQEFDGDAEPPHLAFAGLSEALAEGAHEGGGGQPAPEPEPEPEGDYFHVTESGEACVHEDFGLCLLARHIRCRRRAGGA